MSFSVAGRGGGAVPAAVLQAPAQDGDAERGKFYAVAVFASDLDGEAFE
jgi:hypothetical protein